MGAVEKGVRGQWKMGCGGSGKGGEEAVEKEVRGQWEKGVRGQWKMG